MHISSACLSACLLAVGGKDQFFSQCRISTHYHRFVVLIKIYPLHHSESFYPSLLLLLFDWWMKRWEITKEVSMNYNGLYLLRHGNHQMRMCMIASCIKIITGAMFLPCTNSSQLPLMLRLICVSLGCDLPIQLLLLISLSSVYNYRLVDCFHHADSTDSHHELRNM